MSGKEYGLKLVRQGKFDELSLLALFEEAGLEVLVGGGVGA